MNEMHRSKTTFFFFSIVCMSIRNEGETQSGLFFFLLLFTLVGFISKKNVKEGTQKTNQFFYAWVRS